LVLASLLQWATARVSIEVPGYAKTVVGGQAKSLHTGRDYYFFHNLKYAQPPTNENRFLPPKPIEPYPDDHVVNGWLVGRGCPQVSSSEDCLIVDIDTPYLPPNGSEPDPEKLLPVMFWIHGGGFQGGQVAYYFGYKLMEHDIVLVEVQYRLSALGWLSLDTDEVPGNAGLFDQIEALRWVQKNIKYFGGDPNRVTVFGESAGAASVSLLLLAPQARDLFHRVIAQSGSMLTDWALDRKAREHGLRITELAGCPLEPYDGPNGTLHCLRTIDAETLLRAEREANRIDRYNGGLGFTGCSPVIQSAGEQRALTKEPRALIDAADYTTDVPILMGANQEEGIYCLGILLDDYVRPHGYEFDEEYMTYGVVPSILGALGVRDDTGAIADVLTDKYLDGFLLGNFTEMIPGLMDMTATLFMKAGGWQTVVQHAKYGAKSYWYSYDYRAKLSVLGSSPPIPQGINHADELPNFFFMNPVMSDVGIRLSKQMMQLWTNFAAYGELTPEGVELLEGIPFIPPYDSENQFYVSFTADGPVILNDYTQTYTVTGDNARPDRKRRRN